MTAFTVILPHKRNPGNDDALAVCLDCLARNTVNEYALIMDAAFDSPLFPRVNRMIEQAHTERVVYLASDMFFAPAWDVPMMEAWTPELIITNVVVEPGAIAMHPMNYHRDFGRKPATFQRERFEAWARSSEAELTGGEGWYCPYMVSRDYFLAMGGFDTTLTSPDGFTPADVDFFARWKAMGRGVKRVKSFIYHLQRYSDEDEQQHEKRG